MRAIEFLLTHEVSGPVNLTGPEPAPQRDVVKALAQVAHRPWMFPAPRFGLKLVLGEFADDVLASQRATPTVLQGAGYAFTHPTLDAAARWVLAPR